MGYGSEVRQFLVKHRFDLTDVHAEKQLREGASHVLKADLLAEQRLVLKLCKLWPDTPVLCEEAEHSELPKQVPSVHLLPYRDNVTDLSDTLISVDGLDGSALYKVVPNV